MCCVGNAQNIQLTYKTSLDITNPVNVAEPTNGWESTADLQMAVFITHTTGLCSVVLHL